MKSTIEEVALVLKLLGDKTRLKMVKILESRECCVCELVHLFDMSQPAISQHLRKLRDVGLIIESRKGQWVYYGLNKQYENFPFVCTLLNQLPSQEGLLESLEKQGLRVMCD
ncbi:MULTISPECIES: ArsR/SmtB family transcription factor [Cytobacillus]|uniref:Winged helix-turn-helix transcriptional regulator n=1 Tax=Cytobacillus stercorigallinarum TaxID=2762240 RepID=A0ABR8QN95_9BACI|nr:metalloregulator ArsR/SmtB family transcription factor [Cytobacillus stercorigallinarum]MBD7937001.1 winged helix-turn-helix transcriptional regulator [Cytobacillus stercorigallinarum]